METLKIRDYLQKILTEARFPGWHMIAANNRYHPANCLILHPKAKRIGEASIAAKWPDKPHQRSTIRGALVSAILNFTAIFPQPVNSPILA